MDIIKPWLTLDDEDSDQGGIDWNTYVPPDIEKIALDVLKNYDLKVSDMSVLATKPEFGGAIWKMDTDKGPYTFKLLHRNPHRSLFSVYAQDYLVKKGARVPSLIPTSDGTLYIHSHGKIWITSEWINDLIRGNEEDLSNLIDLCYGLGDFHRMTKEYQPPTGVAKASRIYKWFGFYEKIKTKIGWFKYVAEAYQDIPSSRNLLSVIDMYAQQADEAIKQLHASSYQRMIQMGEPHWGLVHQDFGWSNGNFGPGGLWVLDLDGVSYDLPIRDLQKLITSTMKDLDGWDVNLIHEMIGAYHQANPIDRETYELLLVDLSLPNDLYKNVKPILFEPEVFLHEEMDPLLAQFENLERTKWDALAELKKEVTEFKPMNYQTTSLHIPIPIQRIQLPTDITKLDISYTDTSLENKTDQADRQDDKEEKSKKERKTDKRVSPPLINKKQIEGKKTKGKIATKRQTTKKQKTLSTQAKSTTKKIEPKRSDPKKTTTQKAVNTKRPTNLKQKPNLNNSRKSSSITKQKKITSQIKSKIENKKLKTRSIKENTIQKNRSQLKRSQIRLIRTTKNVNKRIPLQRSVNRILSRRKEDLK